MAYRELEPVSKQFTIVIGLTVVGFMAFGLALSYYRNALFEQTLESIQDQNNALRNQIELGHRDLEYYESVQYKDKYAKENMGLLNPGEKVLIITQQVKTVSFPVEGGDSTLSDQQEAAFLELLRQMPVIEHWKLYLFHRDSIETLKKAL
jgi:hypothetical protein